MSKEHFSIVKCTIGGKGFIAGDKYAIIGGNNGLHIFRIDENGDPKEYLAFNMGDSDVNDNGEFIGGIDYISDSDGLPPIFGFSAWGTWAETKAEQYFEIKE